MSGGGPGFRGLLLDVGRRRTEHIGSGDPRVRGDAPVLPVLYSLGALGHREAQSSGHFGGATELVDQLGILVHGRGWLVHAKD